MHNAELYQECNVIQKRDVVACWRNQEKKMKWKENNNRIMDVGCGDGSVMNIIKKYFPSNFELVGCDISENMVAFATDRHGNERTCFTVLDIAGDLPDSTKANFDYVFSSYAIHWIVDQKKAFENIFNLLDEDGQCFMIFLGNHPVYDVYRVLSRNNKWRTWVRNVDKYISPYHDSEEPESEITRLMQNIGFVDIDVECKDSTFLFPNIEILKKLLTAINPFKIPEDKKDEFLEDYVELLKDIENSHEINTDNFRYGVKIYYKLLVVYGRRPPGGR